MSFSNPRAVRILVVSGLFLALPLLGLAQRFGGANTSNPRVTQNQVQTPTPTPQAGGQRGPGQARPGDRWSEWWKDEAIKKELGLSTQQVRSITRIYEDRARQMKPHDDEYQKQRIELDKMIRERIVDVATVSIQVTRVEALRTELIKSRTVMLYGFYRILTAEQYEKLRGIWDRRRNGRGGGGSR